MLTRSGCRLQRLFDESFYADLNGGILEGFGRLLRFNLKIYVYPTLDERTCKLITASDVKVTFLIPAPAAEASLQHVHIAHL